MAIEYEDVFADYECRCPHCGGTIKIVYCARCTAATLPKHPGKEDHEWLCDDCEGKDYAVNAWPIDPDIWDRGADDRLDSPGIE